MIVNLSEIFTRTLPIRFQSLLVVSWSRLRGISSRHISFCSTGYGPSIPYTKMENRTRRSLAPLFNGEERSFPFWKVRMEQHLKQEGLLHTLVNTVADESYAQPTPGATTQQENDRQTKLAKRNKEEDAAINELWMALNDESMSHVMQLQSAKEIMEKLQEVYQPQGAVAMISLRSKLYLLSNKRFQSLKDLFAAHHELVRQLESMGEAVDHMEQIRTLLVAIPEQFKHLLGALSVIRKQELQTMSLEQIKRIFLDADETIGKDAGVSQAAFIGHNRETKKKNQGGKPFRSEHPKKNMVCFECGKVGHKRRNCFQLKKKVNQGRVSSEENLAAATVDTYKAFYNLFLFYDITILRICGPI